MYFPGIGGERAQRAKGPQVPEQWSVDGDVITSSRLLPNKTLSVSFKLGEEFLDTTIGDGKYKVRYIPVMLNRIGSEKIYSILCNWLV